MTKIRINDQQIRKAVAALRMHGGNKQAAAKGLGIPRSTLRRHITLAEGRGLLNDTVKSEIAVTAQENAVTVIAGQLFNLVRLFSQMILDFNPKMSAQQREQFVRGYFAAQSKMYANFACCEGDDLEPWESTSGLATSEAKK